MITTMTTVLLALTAPASASNFSDGCRTFPVTQPDGTVKICVYCPGGASPQCY